MNSAKSVVGAMMFVFACCLGGHPIAPAFATDYSLQYAPQALATCGQPNAKTLKAIVPVTTDHGSFASGIVVGRNLVLTAAHAVQGGGHFFVRIGTVYRSAELAMVDHTNDLAVLAVNTLNLEPLPIATAIPYASETVWAVGYPRARAISSSVGTFQQLVGNAFHTSASIDPGQSGGGLLSCSQGSWSLIGMLRGYGAYLQGDHYVKLQNHSISVAGITINDFLRHF